MSGPRIEQCSDELDSPSYLRFDVGSKNKIKVVKHIKETTVLDLKMSKRICDRGGQIETPTRSEANRLEQQFKALGANVRVTDAPSDGPVAPLRPAITPKPSNYFGKAGTSALTCAFVFLMWENYYGQQDAAETTGPFVFAFFVLSALSGVYYLARGLKLLEREHENEANMSQRQLDLQAIEESIKKVEPAQVDLDEKVEKLERLASLKENGAITEDDYEKMKNQILKS